jgi:Zn-dependent M28 family amino/carboxypeptidase
MNLQKISCFAVLEIARVMKNAAPPRERSVIFLFTTGEEEGLLGSTYYTDHPIVPLYKTVANINVDGLAMFDRFRNVVGVGAELSTLGDYLNTIAGDLGCYVSSIPFFSSRSMFWEERIIRPKQKRRPPQWLF